MCMKKRNIRVVLAIVLWLAALWYFPSLFRGGEQTALPRAQRELMTVWLCGDTLGADGWVREQAAAFQKENRHISVWVRQVTQEDLMLLQEDYHQTAPDVLIFGADVQLNAEYVLQVQPLGMAGYALVKRSQTQITPAPTSLFGVTPVPEESSAATVPPRELWPEKIAADDGLGAYFLQMLSAPHGAQLMDKTQLVQYFQQEEEAAALLSTRQIKTLSAQGVGVEVLQAVPGSDLVFFGAVMQKSTDAAEKFLQQLLTEKAQCGLSACGLFSAQGYRLYGAGTPVMQAVETALIGGWIPDPLLWPGEREMLLHAAQAMYTVK